MAYRRVPMDTYSYLQTSPLDDMHPPSYETAVEARHIHQMAQLQLTSIATLNAIKDMNDRSVNAQRDIRFQAQQLSLKRAIMELRSNILSLKVKLVLENDEGKKQDMNVLLGSMEEEENTLEMELSKMDHDYLAVLRAALYQTPQ